jgi:hypothetical protein
VNTLDDKNVGKSVDESLIEPVRWGRWAVLAGIVLLVALLATGWLMRKAVAERVLAGWCDARNLVCEGKVTQLGLGGATIRALKISASGDVPLQAQEVTARLGWPGLFTPELTGVVIDTPIVRGTLDDKGVKFYGLEKLASSSSEQGNSELKLPAIDITGGRIFLGTDAGELSASVSMNGTFPQKGKLDLVLDPASLQTHDSEFQWSEGVVSLSADNGLISGGANVVLEQANLKGISVRDALLEMTMDAADVGDGPMQVNWTGSVAEAAFPGGELRAARTSGSAAFAELPSLSTDAVMNALTQASFTLEAEKISQGGYGANSLNLEADLKGDGGNIGGPVAVEASQVAAPQGKAGNVSASGVLSRSAEGTLLYTGSVVTQATQLSPETRGKVTKPITLPGILSDHGGALRTTIDRALTDFDLTMNFSVGRRADLISISSRGETVLTTKSGMRLGIVPGADGPWLSVRGQDVLVSGDISLAGGGAPTLQLGLDELQQGAAGFDIKAHDLRLKPWAAGGKTVSADLSTFSLSSGKDAFDLRTLGRLSLAGLVSGVDLKSTDLSGGIHVTRGETGWQVTPEGVKCVRASSKGFVFGSIKADPLSLDICPQGKGFIREDTTDPEGAVTLGNVNLPFTTGSTSGTLGLPNATVDWSSKGGLAMTILAKKLDLPLTIGDRTLTIEGDTLRMGVATGKSAPRLSARLGATRFGGTLVPATVSADSFSFDGSSGKGGLSGSLKANAVLIKDYRDDPLYQPLIAELSATLTDGQLLMTGPLRLKAGGVTVADTTLNMDIIALTGKAEVRSKPLQFRTGGLQPVMLSERLRGVFTFAEGDMSALADIDINSGKLSGTGEVTVSNFGFQTTRLGRVTGVEGHIHFSDLLALTTDKGQVVTVGLMNIGVPLADGHIEFHLDDGQVIGVEKAYFPFAGGRVALSPLEWTLGGDNQRVEVTAESIELSQLVAVLKLPDVQATGTVSGRFPVDFVDNEVQVRDARLSADAKGGRISYTGDAVDSAAESDPNAKLAFDALKDLQFSVLEVGLTGNLMDRTVASVHLLGKNTGPLAFGKNLTMPKGQAFEFNLTLDSQLGELVKSSSYATQQDKFVDIIVDLAKSKPDTETE